MYIYYAGRKWRDMNKKFVFLMLMFCLMVMNVKAESLVINGLTYDASQDINGEGYHYDSTNNILKLNNYDGSYIKKDGALNIVLSGDNHITNGKKLIEATSLTIDGDGSLELIGTFYGIYASSIVINNARVYGNIEGSLFVFDSELSIRNSIIEVNSNSVLIMGGNYISVKDSYIKANCYWGFRYLVSGESLIENSTLDMKCIDECLNIYAKMSFVNSNATFQSDEVVTNNANLVFDENSNYVVSTDGVNYSDNLSYKGYPYIKIFSNANNNQDSSSNGEENDNSSNDSENDDNVSLPILPDNENSNEDNLGNDNYTENEFEDNEVDINNPKTGDEVIKWLLILLLSILGMIGFGLLIKGIIDGKNKDVYFE